MSNHAQTSVIFAPTLLSSHYPTVQKGMWCGGEVDTIFGFEKEADALEWIKEKSQAWLIEQNRATRVE
jgi:hypothetical protein